MTAARQIGFDLLGPVRVRADNRAVFPATHLRRGLLAVLVLHGNQLVPVDKLLTCLWNDPPASARANLRSQLTRLRRDLDSVLTGLSGRITVQRSARGGGGGGVRLDVDASEVDILEVERLVTAAGVNVYRPDRAIEALFQCHRARHLWRGDFGVDLPDTEWFTTRATATAELRRVMVETLHTAELANGHYDHAVVGLNAAIAEDSYRDRLWVLRAVAHFLAGHTSQALEVLRGCRAKYREVGLDVPAGITGLHRPILDGDHGAVMATVGLH